MIGSPLGAVGEVIEDAAALDVVAMRAALRREQRFSSAIVDSAGNLMLVLDRHGRIVRFNGACERTTGYAFAEVNGRYFWDLFLVPEEVLPIKAVFANLHGGHFPERYENYWVTRSGEWRLISWSNTAILGDTGELEFIVSAGIDMTESKHVEENLRASEARLALQYAVMTVLSRSTGIMEAMTALLQTVCEHLGWSVGLFWEPGPDEDTLRCAATWHSGPRELAEFVARVKDTSIGPATELPGRVWSSGEPLWAVDVATEPPSPHRLAAAEAELHGSVGFPVLSEGRVCGVLEFFSRDYHLPHAALQQAMTALGIQAGQFIERAKAQDALRKERDFSSAVLDTAGSLVVVLDRHGAVVRFNAACERATGYTLQDVRGRPFRDFFVVPEHILPAETPWSADQPAAYEGFAMARSGEWRLIAWSNAVLCDDDGRPEYVVATGVDITERRQAEEDLQASEARLGLQYAATTALARSATLDDAIPTFLRTLGEQLGWDAALFWSPDALGEHLRCMESWSRPEASIEAFIESKRRLEVPPGTGLPGAVWMDRASTWVVDVAVDERYLLGAAAAQAGLHGAVCFPVAVGDRLYGAIEVLSRHIQPPNSDLEQTLASLGIQVGQFLEHRLAEEQRRESSERFRALIEKAPVGACIVDEHAVFETVNAAYSQMLGYAPEELIGRSLTMVLPTADRAQHVAAYTARLEERAEAQGEYEVVTKGGDLLTLLVTSTPIPGTDGRPRRASFAIDITERKRAEQQLDYLAHHDPLTGLPNRKLFRDRLEQELSRARRYRHSLAVLFLDLDGFKTINDTLGHHVGDLLLREVARRLRQCTRESDMVSRLAGDEFTVILPEVRQVEDAEAVAAKILAALAAGATLDGHSISVGSSIGISLYPHHGDDLESIVNGADAAMYRAKNGGKNTYRLAAPDPVSSNGKMSRKAG